MLLSLSCSWEHQASAPTKHTVLSCEKVATSRNHVPSSAPCHLAWSCGCQSSRTNQSRPHRPSQPSRSCKQSEAVHGVRMQRAGTLWPGRYIEQEQSYSSHTREGVALSGNYLCLRDWPVGTLMLRGDCLAGSPLGVPAAPTNLPLVLSLTFRPAMPLPMLSCMAHTAHLATRPARASQKPQEYRKHLATLCVKCSDEDGLDRVRSMIASYLR